MIAVTTFFLPDEHWQISGELIDKIEIEIRSSIKECLLKQNISEEMYNVQNIEFERCSDEEACFWLEFDEVQLKILIAHNNEPSYVFFNFSGLFEILRSRLVAHKVWLVFEIGVGMDSWVFPDCCSGIPVVLISFMAELETRWHRS
jgi:hypothetical protein